MLAANPAVRSTGHLAKESEWRGGPVGLGVLLVPVHRQIRNMKNRRTERSALRFTLSRRFSPFASVSSAFFQDAILATGPPKRIFYQVWPLGQYLASLDELDPGPAALLWAAIHERSEAERDLIEAIKAARASGMSWSAIGLFVATSANPARQRRQLRAVTGAGGPVVLLQASHRYIPTAHGVPSLPSASPRRYPGPADRECRRAAPASARGGRPRRRRTDESAGARRERPVECGAYNLRTHTLRPARSISGTGAARVARWDLCGSCAHTARVEYCSPACNGSGTAGACRLKEEREPKNQPYKGGFREPPPVEAVRRRHDPWKVKRDPGFRDHGYRRQAYCVWARLRGVVR